MSIHFVHAERHISGIIDRNTRWNAEDGPFHLTGDLFISRHCRLTISPGSKIIVGTISTIDTQIHQVDKIDSSTIAIKVHGTLICIGRIDKRIVFTPASEMRSGPIWYGIRFVDADDQFTEIAYTDITNAYIGISITNCSPLIRNSIIEFNHIGISCNNFGAARIYNNIVTNNTAAGIRIRKSNPEIFNNIILNNHNSGVWCDGSSRITFEYNCIFGNRDGNFLDCNPEYCKNVKKKKNGDSIDVFKNICVDPVFEGSPAETAARKADLNIPTESAYIRDTTIAAIINDSVNQANESSSNRHRYKLSPYSPCIDAGHPSKKFNDRNDTKNDIGIFGGPKFIESKR
jgi:parallel beta-helix repeat protein